MSGNGLSSNSLITLGEFLVHQQKSDPQKARELSQIFGALRLTAKVLNRETNKAGLVDVIGSAGMEDPDNSKRQPLDVFANDKMKAALRARGLVAGMVSGHDANFIAFPDSHSQSGNYVAVVNPLDGLSNVDINVSIGTMFSVYRRLSPVDGPAQLADFLQPGTEQVAAGYVIFGSSTMFVYTTGQGVHGFTYDPSIGVFYLSHENIRLPEQGSIYSVNEGNYLHFPDGVKRYIKHCQEENPAEGRPHTSRYVGSLVADFHRNLLKGGIYLYPSHAMAPEGKLRLLFECNALAWIAEEAGGVATDGQRSILEIEPTSLRQTVPYFVGSRRMVETLQGFL